MGNKASSTSSSLNFEKLNDDLKNGVFKNIVVMCGAGISTSAGIPDFRTPSAGLYFKLKKYDLPYPEAVFEGSYFRQNPLPFFSLVRELFPAKLVPTPTHKFFSLLHSKGYLKRVYTQNIDALEILGGLPTEKVIEAHGTFLNGYCTSCSAKYDLTWLRREIFRRDVPKCDKCPGVVRPDVVLFGESLPDRFWSHLNGDFKDCDLLLVFGTSLAVSPFNSLVNKPGKEVPRVYINRTDPGSSGSLVGWMMGMSGNVKFDKATDLVLKDDCDKIVQEICEKNDWTEDLDNIPSTIMDNSQDVGVKK